jgi:hypothetical protein
MRCVAVAGSSEITEVALAIPGRPWWRRHVAWCPGGSRWHGRAGASSRPRVDRPGPRGPAGRPGGLPRTANRPGCGPPRPIGHPSYLRMDACYRLSLRLAARLPALYQHHQPTDSATVEPTRKLPSAINLAAAPPRSKKCSWCRTISSRTPATATTGRTSLPVTIPPCQAGPGCHPVAVADRPVDSRVTASCKSRLVGPLLLAGVGLGGLRWQDLATPHRPGVVPGQCGRPQPPSFLTTVGVSLHGTTS